jgi:hypothetical protein
VILLIVLGVAGVAGGGMGLGRELTRTATRAEMTAALSREIATRWQRLPAGEIFPATIGYTNAQSVTTTATRVGIAPPASCRAALEASALRRIRSLGCTTMLRATYADASGMLAVTVGIGVMASPAAASTAYLDLSPLAAGGGLHTVAFRGTITDAFSDSERGAAGIQQVSGPYVFLYTAGYTDGLPGAVARANPELVTLGSGILETLETVLTSHASTCTMRDIRC